MKFSFQVGLCDVTLPRNRSAIGQHCPTSRYLVLKVISWIHHFAPARSHCCLCLYKERIGSQRRPILHWKRWREGFRCWHKWVFKSFINAWHLCWCCLQPTDNLMTNFLLQVTNYDNNTGLPLVHMWNMVGEEVKISDFKIYVHILTHTHSSQQLKWI